MQLGNIFKLSLFIDLFLILEEKEREFSQKELQVQIDKWSLCTRKITLARKNAKVPKYTCAENM